MAESINPDRRRVGENVRSARRYRGVSVEALAGLVGRSKSWVSKIENGRLPLERRSDIAALAEALDVSASDLLGEPTPAIRPQGRRYGDVVGLRTVLLDSSIESPMDIRPRPLAALEELVAGPLHRMRQESDDAQLTTTLPGLLTELHVHTASSLAAERDTALRMVVDLSISAVHVLRHLGQPDLAWIAARHAEDAARALGDPVMIGGAAMAMAMSRPAASMSRALRDAEMHARTLEEYADTRTGAEVRGMLLLYASLTRQIQGDDSGSADLLAEASELAGRLGEQPSDTCGEGWRSFGPANVGIWTAAHAVERGEPEAALAAARAVDVKALPRRTRIAALVIEQSRALAMLGDGGGAVQQLRKAEKMSAPTVHNHPLVRELVADLYDRAIGRDLRGLAWRMDLI